MNGQALFLLFVEVATLTGGHLLLKLALSEDDPAKPGTGRSKTRRAWIFAAGIFGMTISFFVNLGLLQKLDLSLVFPFQGLSVLVVTLLATLLLKERLTLTLLVGTLLITVGVILVSAN